MYFFMGLPPQTLLFFWSFSAIPSMLGEFENLGSLEIQEFFLGGKISEAMRKGKARQENYAGLSCKNIF